MSHQSRETETLSTSTGEASLSDHSQWICGSEKARKLERRIAKALTKRDSVAKLIEERCLVSEQPPARV
jgi:hypothetical protein